MPTLYRQYRPQTFAEVAGQDHITKTLQAALEKDRVAHAYLFYGPRGTGKTTTARLLAKRLNCLKPKGAEPCLTCKLCVATQENRNIDIIEIDAASNRGIDDIRALRENVGSSPAMGEFKVYIIDEVHMLTPEAFAALLKTLEEPVKHAVFVLATTELHKVPATILSRCQVFRFRRATHDEMHTRLTHILKQEKREADKAALEFIIARSDGCYRDAESLLGQLLTLKDKTINLDDMSELLGLPSLEIVDQFLTALVANDLPSAIGGVDQLYATGHDGEQFLLEAIRLSRDAAVQLTKQEKPAWQFAQAPTALARLPLIIRSLLQALQDMAYVPEPRLAIQLAVFSVCESKVQAQPVQAASRVQQPVHPVRHEKPARDFSFPKKAPAVTAGEDTRIEPVKDSQQGVVSLGTLKDVWPKLITAVKEANPVASTFLRAVEPLDVEGDVVRLRMQYALHRNFFEKPENRALVEEHLSKLLETKVRVTCHLDVPGVGISGSVKEKIQQQEEDLFAAAKEVFRSSEVSK